MKARFRKSEVKQPVFHHPITVPELMTLAALIGLQNMDLLPDANNAMRWVLAYWRADRETFERHDRACVFFHGRFGLDTMSMDDVCGEWAELFDAQGGTVTSTDVNDFVQWAFNNYIEWEPEAPKRYLGPLDAVKVSARAALLLNELCYTYPLDVGFVMSKLADNFAWNSPVWYAMEDATRVEGDLAMDKKSYRIRWYAGEDLRLIVDIIDGAVWAVPTPEV